VIDDVDKTAVADAGDLAGVISSCGCIPSESCAGVSVKEGHPDGNGLEFDALGWWWMPAVTLNQRELPR
jgi:hypothetical protein